MGRAGGQTRRDTRRAGGQRHPRHGEPEEARSQIEGQEARKRGGWRGRRAGQGHQLGRRRPQVGPGAPGESPSGRGQGRRDNHP